MQKHFYRITTDSNLKIHLFKDQKNSRLARLDSRTTSRFKDLSKNIFLLNYELEVMPSYFPNLLLVLNKHELLSKIYQEIFLFF